MSQPSGPQAKTERLLNLVLCLLYTRRPLPKARLREIVPQYAAAPTSEAFERMFERDKDELRELGIPLVTEELNSIFEDEPGYRIHERDYALPDIHFEPDELAALALAGRTWDVASLAGPAAEAMRKLRASGLEPDPTSLIGVEPRLRTPEPSFDDLRRAVVTCTPVVFDYHRPGGEATTRHLQPWGMAQWHGRWYVSGFDIDRGAERVFRLSRISGDVSTDGAPGSYAVPADHDASASVGRSASTERTPEPAAIRVKSGQGHALRRRARSVEDVDADWAELHVDYTDPELLAAEISSFGPDVVAISPAEVVDAVVRRLSGVLSGGAHGEGQR